ncbi:MAG: AAA family ATPase [Clostridia bacterium]|nr:AAA family ATPase [Clostridia bacterium]
MKLIGCYVENFGKLSHLTLTFGEGTTCFCLPNGEGKTTLVAFLKAMLYGMDGYRETTTGFCDRRRYFPFSGGRFGGSLQIEWRGERYTIERTFDKKSESKDELLVYDGTGKKSAVFEGKVGERIFGLDRATFERAAFIDAERTRFSFGGSIREKLSELVADAPKVSIARAVETLDEERKRLRADRKTAGRLTGALPTLEREIYALEEELFSLSEKREEWKSLIKEQGAASAPPKEKEKRLKSPWLFLLAAAFAAVVGGGSFSGNLPFAIGSFVAAALLVFCFFIVTKGKGQGRVDGGNDGKWQEVALRNARLLEKIDRLKEELALEEEKRERLARLKEERTNLEKRRILIEKAKEKLLQADEKLRGDYRRPMEESFLRYARALDGEFFSSVAFDGELEPYFIEGGSRREAEHFSDGAKTLLGLSMRLALIENLFRKEKPFLLLDDPFVFLDERRFARTKAALCELGKEWQILYFCCHESRKV